MTGGTWDGVLNKLTLTFSRPVVASGVSSGQITMVGNVTGVRTNNSEGSFGSTSSHAFPTTGSGFGGSVTAVASAPNGIPSVVDAANGAPVDPFTGLVVSLA